jgi:acyl transferase domain-containing protein/acyl-CoA synthetase (AMP-forming)/AMP-acid ligase II/surfactin synthase thioesterase subunit/nucleoside-diphosphate-sugar epimerase
MGTVLTDIIENNLTEMDEVEFTFLKDNQNSIVKTYSSVVIDAKKLAVYLQERFPPQTRILLIYPPSLDFVSAILACFYSGMIAVPAYPLQNPRHAYRLHSIIESCDPKLILGTQTIIDDLSAIEMLSRVEKLATETIFASTTLNDTPIKSTIDETALAFLQYTSGSTGQPKGVMVSHANLLHNLSTIKYSAGLDSTKTSVIWLPFQHDFGLIGGILSSIYTHNPLVLLSPVSVIEKPYRWLKAISDYKAYFTASPNFAFQLCVNKILDEELETLDLSSIGYAIAAAEPNRFETYEQFCTKFAACGFKRESYCVAYGLAENTLHVSSNIKGQISDFMHVSKKHLAKGKIVPSINKEDEYLIMSAGAIEPEHEAVIVNPVSKELCNEDEVGEIWISGRSVAQGYWDNPQRTEETFNVKLSGKYYLRSGDLGFIHGNQLYLTGRQKDLIIIDGRNIYPQDLEAVVDESHDHIKPGNTSAFSVDTGKHEAIVICAEIKRTAMRKDLSDVIPAIRHNIAKHYGVAIHDIKLLRPNRAFKTTSGKIQRSKTRIAYLENTLECVDAKVNTINDKTSKLAADVEHILADILGLKSIDPHQSFSDMGGTSIHATMLHQKLQEYFGPEIQISQTIAFDYPTLAELINYANNPKGGMNDFVQEKSTTTDTQFKVAIIGIGCRLPGKVRNLDDLWTLLSTGVDAVEPIPRWRWDIEHYDNEVKNRISQAGVLEDIDQFEPAFFNISPREALQMDPQHRLLLEVAWEALENAAIPAHSLKKKKVGVFVGSSSADYRSLISTHHSEAARDPFFIVDNASSVMAGRIAYYLGTRGPAETIDTACSSSLVVLDSACQALQLGRINMAIAGGVNIILSPENSVGLANANMLSPTNRCHTFSQDADGYVRAEGCALIVLKRLEDALKDGDIIHAVIQSTAVNQDGASSGITVPSLQAQKQLLVNALNQANLSPNDIDYIEAHGSATVLGDPIEFGAISAVYGNQNRNKPLYIGSVKSNIGHLEAASGIAGVLKTIAALTHQMLPANIHINSVNPKLDINPEVIEIVRSNSAWTPSNQLRRAGVSSFGFSGTNAHIILEEAPALAIKGESELSGIEKLFVLSARSQHSLHELITAYVHYLERSVEDIEDICFTAAVGRCHFTHRLALIIKDKEDLLAQLKASESRVAEVTLNDEEITSTDLHVLVASYLQGNSINWDAYYKPYLKSLRKVVLPTYCFNRQRYWLDIKKTKSLPYGERVHELLGAKVPGHSHEVHFINRLDFNELEYLKEYCIDGQRIFPGAGFIEGALASGVNLLGENPLSLKDVSLLSSLTLETAVDCEYTLDPISEKAYKGVIYAYNEHKSDWMHQADFTIEHLSNPDRKVTDLARLQATLDVIDVGQRENIKEAFVGQGVALVAIKNDAITTKGYYFHPSLFNGVLQAVALVSHQEPTVTYIPTQIACMNWYQKAEGLLWAKVTLTNQDAQSATFDVKITDNHGMLLAEIDDLVVSAVTQDTLKNLLSQKGHLSHYVQNYQKYTLPKVQKTKDEAIIVYANHTKAALLNTYAKTNHYEELNNKHVVFMYEENFSTLVSLAKQLFIHKPLSFTLVTRSAFSVSHEDVINPNHTQAVGFWRSLHQEARGFPCYLIDIKGTENISNLMDLIREGALPEPQVIVRQQIYIPRLLMMKEHAEQTPFSLKPEATYLITGGTGGIGLELAKYLITKGAVHLALTSRRKPSKAMNQWMEEQNAQGVLITHYTADVANLEDMRSLFIAIAKSKYPLKGIFHAAGMIHDGLLANLSDENFHSVLAPKITGSLHLHELSKELELDCFVLFSSIVSLIGNAGQTNYATANAFMDGLAIQRCNQGLPAVSINLGPFANIGMASDLNAIHLSQGVKAINIHQGLEALYATLSNTHQGQVGIMDVDWSKIPTLNNPYLEHLVVMHKTKAQSEWQLLLEATPQERHEQVLTDKIKEILAQALRMPDPDGIDINQGFFEMGVDSLVAIELKNILQSKIGDALTLSNTITFDYPNVKQMVNYFLQSFAPKKTAVITPKQKTGIQDEEIAIIGVSGEFPGAGNLDEFWQLLLSAQESVRDVPNSRWNIDEFYDANQEAYGKMITRRGGFIKDIEQFDANFFSISPKEATYLDPQHRLLLKHTWLALESAGISPHSLNGSDTGVFIGISTNDYGELIQQNEPLNEINAYIGTGNALSTASGRISYLLGLQGPNLAIDTACSSSLVALNEACARLRSGECGCVLVGGVNVLLSPTLSIIFSKAGMLAPDGKCKTFDEKADGYVRGEGCGMVVLKRLSDALRDKDPIWAVIKASAINQDGASSGLTVPSGVAQERLLTRVLELSNLSAKDIDYLECHGTGTRLGDPIEVHALGQVYGKNRTKEAPLMIGSVKTNIGHLESAAGIAGLIKVVLALKNNKIPGHLNFTQLNSNISLNFPAEIVTETKDWKTKEAPRRAAVSSFGFSGTNAHVILEEAPLQSIEQHTAIELPTTHVFILSAKTKKSLNDLIKSYIYYLDHSNECIENICFTTALGRAHFTHRLALLVKNKDDLLSQLKSHELNSTEVSLTDGIIVSQDPNVLVNKYMSGHSIDWNEYYKPYTKALKKINLPTYCFDTQQYWVSENKKNIKNTFKPQETTANEVSFQTLGMLIKQSTTLDKKHLILNYLTITMNKISGASFEFLRAKNSVQNLGLDSIMLMQLQARIEKDLGVAMNFIALQNSDDLDAISDLIETAIAANGAAIQEQTYDSRESQLLNKPENVDYQLFIISPLGFGADAYSKWPARLANNIEIVYLGYQYQGSWHDMIEAMALELQAHCKKPFIIYGHSLGGMVAYELASYLEHHTPLRPETLMISSLVPPMQFERIEYVFPFNQIAKGAHVDVVELLTMGHYLPPDTMGLTTVSPEEISRDAQAIIDYSYNDDATISTPIVAIQANNDVLVRDASFVSAWSKYTTDYFTYLEIEGTHLFFTNPQQEVFNTIEEVLRESNAPQSVELKVYQLREYIQGSNQNNTYPLGIEPKGYIIYDQPTQSMAVHLWNAQAEKSLKSLPKNENKRIIEFMMNHMAYCGHFVMNSSEVHHYIKSSSIPNYTDDILSRYYHAEHGNLTLTTLPKTLKKQRHELYQQLIWNATNNDKQQPPLAGCWELIDYYENNEAVLGNEPVGQMLITDTAYFSMQMSQKNRQEFKDTNIYLASNEELLTAYHSNRNLFGTCVMSNQDGGMVCNVLSPTSFEPQFLSSYVIKNNELHLNYELEIEKKTVIVKSRWRLKQSR